MRTILPDSEQKALRCRLSPARADFSDPRAQMMLRRLYGLPHRDLIYTGAKGGRTLWIEWPHLTPGQIEGYVGLFASYGVPADAMEVVG